MDNYRPTKNSSTPSAHFSENVEGDSSVNIYNQSSSSKNQSLNGSGG